MKIAILATITRLKNLTTKKSANAIVKNAVAMIHHAQNAIAIATAMIAAARNQTILVANKNYFLIM